MTVMGSKDMRSSAPDNFPAASYLSMLRNFTACVTAAFLLAAFPVNASAQEQDEAADASADESAREDIITFRFGGQYTNLFTYTKADVYREYPDPPYYGTEKKKFTADLNRLRLSPEMDVSDNIHARVDFDNEAIFSNYLEESIFDQYWGISDYNDLADMTAERERGSLYYRCKLHRAYVKFAVSDLTVTAGRQQIRFGSARLWNPLDLLNPVTPFYVEGAEEQKGTDAVRLEYYLTETAEVDFIADGKRMDDDRGLSSSNIRGNTLARIKFTAGETDIAGIGGYISKRKTGGFDVSSVLFDGMLNASALYASPEKGESFVQASAGYEYNFRYVYFLIEYFFNQNGLNYNDELKNVYESSLLTGINKDNYYLLSNQLITYNQHYTGIFLSGEIVTLLRAELFTIYDFQGKGVFFAPSIKYNALENVDIVLGIMGAHIFDKEPSDFKSQAEFPLILASLKWYF